VFPIKDNIPLSDMPQAQAGTGPLAASASA